MHEKLDALKAEEKRLEELEGRIWDLFYSYKRTMTHLIVEEENRINDELKKMEVA